MAAIFMEESFRVIAVMLYVTLFLITGVTIAYNPDVAFFLTGLLIFLLFFFHTKFAVFGYAAYLAFEETILQYIPSSFYLFLKYSGDMMLVLLALSVFAKLATRRYSLSAIRRSPINLPLLIFIIVAIASILINEMPPYIAFVGMRQLLRFVVLYYLVMIISSSEWDEKTVRSLMHLMIVVVIIQACLGYVQLVMGPGSKFNYFLAPGRPYYFESEKIAISTGLSWAEMKGLYGTMLVRNTYAVFMAFFALMFLGMSQVGSDERRKSYLKLFLFIAPCVLLSYSRQATYGLFLGMFTMAYIRKNKKLAVALILAVLAFTLYVSQFRIEEGALNENAPLIDKMASPFQAQYLRWSSKLDRLYVLTHFGPKVLGSKYVLIGTGPASFGSAIGDTLKYYDGYEKYGIPLIGPKMSFAISDTGFFALLGQFGIFGTLSLIWIFLSLFHTVLKRYQKIDDIGFKGFALGTLGIIPTLLFSNVGYINLDLRQISFYFWLLSAVTLTYWGRETEAKLEAAGFIGETR